MVADRAVLENERSYVSVEGQRVCYSQRLGARLAKANECKSGERTHAKESGEEEENPGGAGHFKSEMKQPTAGAEAS